MDDEEGMEDNTIVIVPDEVADNVDGESLEEESAKSEDSELEDEEISMCIKEIHSIMI